MKTVRTFLVVAFFSFLGCGLVHCSMPVDQHQTHIDANPSTQPGSRPATQPGSTQVNANTTTGTVAVTADIQKLVDIAVAKSLVELNTTITNKVTSEVKAQVGLLNQDSHSPASTNGNQSPAITFTGSGGYLLGGCILFAAVTIYSMYSRAHYKGALSQVVSSLHPEQLLNSLRSPTKFGSTILQVQNSLRLKKLATEAKVNDAADVNAINHQ